MPVEIQEMEIQTTTAGAAAAAPSSGAAEAKPKTDLRTALEMLRVRGQRLLAD